MSEANISRMVQVAAYISSRTGQLPTTTNEARVFVWDEATVRGGIDGQGTRVIIHLDASNTPTNDQLALQRYCAAIGVEHSYNP